MSIPAPILRGKARPQGYLQEVTGTTHATPGTAVTVTIPTDQNGIVLVSPVVIVTSRGAGAVYEDFALRTATTVTVKSPAASIPFVVAFG